MSIRAKQLESTSIPIKHTAMLNPVGFGHKPIDRIRYPFRAIGIEGLVSCPCAIISRAGEL